MDTISFGFVLTIVFIGGITAYTADLLGRHLGKKRLSIFKLRPKYTAILFTTLAGLMIPLITIALIFSFSKEVRVWLIEGQSAVEEKNRKVKELKLMNQKISEVNDQVQKKNAEVLDLEKQKKEVALKLQTSEKEIRALLKKAKALNLKVMNFRKQLQAVEKKYLALEHDRNGLLKESSDLNKTKVDLMQELSSKEIILENLTTQISNLNQQVNVLDTQKKKISTQFDKLGEEFRIKIQQASKDLEKVRQEKDTALKQKQLAMAEVEKLQDLKNHLIAGLDSNIQKTRMTAMISGRGEEIVRAPIKAEMLAAEAKDFITHLLYQAHLITASKGALSKTPDGLTAGFNDLLKKDQTLLTAEQQTELLIKEVQQIKTPSFLRLRSLWNTYVGEYVILTAEVKKNPLLYRKGHVLGEIKINADQSEEKILEQLNQLLNSKIRDKVKMEKLFSTGSSETSLAQISTDQALTTLKILKQMGGMQRVQVIVKNNMRAADTLDLEFRIVDAPKNPK